MDNTLSGGNIQDAIKIAKEHHLACRFAEAECIYRQVLQLEPHNADALHLLGALAYQHGDASAAIDLIRRAIAVRPTEPVFYNNLGNALFQEINISAAISVYEKAIQIKPDYFEAMYNLANALMELGHVADAVIRYETAISLKPEFPEAYYNLGNTWQQLGNFSGAVACYEKAISVKSNYPEACYNCGNALLEQGKLNDAAACYGRAITLAPDYWEAHYNLGFALLELGMRAEAIVSYRRVLELRPQHDTARHILSTIEQSNPERAPAAYVQRLFDYYAPRFDQHLVEKLCYEIPTLLGRAISERLGLDQRKLDVLDLGCGTGLFGITIKKHSKHLAGVDLSQKMLAKAQERQIYDHLVAGDLTDFLASAKAGSFDLIAACDVFVYIGKLTEIFEQVERVLRPGGVFAFSTEECDATGKESVLQTSGRYAQSSGYIRTLCGQANLDKRHSEEVVVRYENGKKITGRIYLLVKTRNG